jgi:hypothetical protein
MGISIAPLKSSLLNSTPLAQVVLPALAGTGVGRAWYGRMFFPERSAVPLTARGGAAGSMQGLTFGAARDATHAAFQSLHHWGGGEWNPASPNPPKPGASLTPSWRSAALRPSVDDGVQREVIDPRRMSESQCPTIARHAHTREVRSHIAMANLRIAGATENGP